MGNQDGKKDEVRRRGLTERDQVPAQLIAMLCTALPRAVGEQPPKQHHS